MFEHIENKRDFLPTAYLDSGVNLNPVAAVGSHGKPLFYSYMIDDSKD
jgi:hypothetical protein